MGTKKSRTHTSIRAFPLTCLSNPYYPGGLTSTDVNLAENDGDPNAEGECDSYPGSHRRRIPRSLADNWIFHMDGGSEK